MKKIELNNGWTLTEMPINVTIPEQRFNRSNQEYKCSLPCDVRMVLLDNNVIKDPVLADYAYDSEWVDEKGWLFYKEFEFVHKDYDTVELVIESIDTYGEIYINGVFIGKQVNAHRPFIKDIREYLNEGINLIEIKVTNALETVSSKDTLELNNACCAEFRGDLCYDRKRGDYRRTFIRKPQYTVGWDWGPKVLSCGIVGDVHIDCYQSIAIREVKAVTTQITPNAHIDFNVNIELLDFFATKDCTYSLKLYNESQEINVNKEKILLTSGTNYIDFSVEIKNPMLWWPNGYGEQNLYKVKFSAECDGVVQNYPEFNFGIRTVELNQSAINDKERLFALVVNDVSIFCKGGDWIPADSIYARVSKDKYKALIEEAVEANFNALRVWGGGIYEKEIFYDLCDKHGIILWQDFMFACATYPDHREEFVEECRKEIDYQTKRLRNRACIGLFCGNNEDHEIFYADQNKNSWNLSYTRNKQYGLYISNVLAKEIIKNNCSHIPYWPSSPFGGEHPAAEAVGDVHYWNDAMMNKDINKRFDPFVYDQLKAKFVSEYGYIGPCSLETIKTYFDGNEVIRGSHIWNLHNNGFEKNTVLAGIKKHYSVDVENLVLEDYLRYAGSVQSLILSYSLEAIRFKENCYGAIFWMYNDTWGEVGWTIIDYYLRRKISFYGVKRAFAIKKLSLRIIDNKIILQACNDTNKSISVKAKVGYMSFDGKISKMSSIQIVSEKRSRSYIASWDIPQEDFTRGQFIVIPESDFEYASLYINEYSKLILPESKLDIIELIQMGENVKIIVRSQTSRI